MKSFSYIAQDARGNQKKGVIIAEDEQAFLAKMKEQGLYAKDYQERDSDNSKSIISYSPQPSKT